MEISVFRSLTEDEIALVSGGGKHAAIIIEAPPPPEPKIPLLPGVLVN